MSYGNDCGIMELVPDNLLYNLICLLIHICSCLVQDQHFLLIQDSAG